MSHRIHSSLFQEDSGMCIPIVLSSKEDSSDASAKNEERAEKSAANSGNSDSLSSSRGSSNEMDTLQNFNLPLDLDIDGCRKTGHVKLRNKSMSSNMAEEEEPTEAATDSYDQEEPVLRSAEDIKSYVLKKLPLEVKEKLSDEAWDRIFEDDDGDMEDDGTNSRMPIKILSISTVEEEEDVISAVSELSCQSELKRQRSKTTKRHRTSNEAIAEECLEACRRLASSDRWNAFENKDTKFKAAAGPSGMGITPPVRQGHRAMSPPPKPQRQTSKPELRVVESSLAMPRRQASMSLRPKEVAFGTVKARFYEPIPEINPSVSSGVAVGIGWMYKSGKVISVDDWEAQKGGLVRSGHQLVLPRRARERKLLDAGFTQKDIAEATRNTLKLKHQRKTTIENLAAKKYAEEMVAKAKRQIQKFLTIQIGGTRPRQNSVSSSTSSSS